MNDQRQHTRNHRVASTPPHRLLRRGRHEWNFGVRLPRTPLSIIELYVWLDSRFPNEPAWVKRGRHLSPP